jgi:HPt (histidine-containing phosphotransfer) domain-containing protein
MARLDQGAIGELRELMGEDFDSLLDAFQADSQVQIDAIAEAVSQTDADRVRRQAHGLKGACINLGANDLAELCGRLEDLGRTGDCASARAVLAALREEFAGLRAALAGLNRL